MPQELVNILTALFQIWIWVKQAGIWGTLVLVLIFAAAIALRVCKRQAPELRPTVVAIGWLIFAGIFSLAVCCLEFCKEYYGQKYIQEIAIRDYRRVVMGKMFDPIFIEESKSWKYVLEPGNGLKQDVMTLDFEKDFQNFRKGGIHSVKSLWASPDGSYIKAQIKDGSLLVSFTEKRMVVAM